MTILGIGVDIVHIPRIAALLYRRGPEKFAHKILSSQEHSQWESLRTSELSTRVRFLAVRWSVKEATYKALYPLVRPTWKEITYSSLSSQGRKPCITYRPTLPEDRDKVGNAHVSISHDGEYVVSSVIFERK